MLMLKSHEKFHSANGKRLVLVVDDEIINREMLGIVLENDYEVIYAEDGLRALEVIREHEETLSLIMLDLMMPGMSGIDVLKQIKADPEINRIPVIVLTADQNAEIESLNLGASDFIPKPYPQAGVIQARVLRTIELSEDRQIIQSTERDPLTGLYNREYFYRYAEQFDHHHKGLEMDALVVDINHFHMINERFGNAYGDDVLRRIGEHLRNMVSDNGGIVCRREADTFMVYCPHGKDYKEILENAALGLSYDDINNNRVRLRIGVYANVDKEMDIERRFDRAKLAADTVRNSFTKNVGIYDKMLHEHELYAEQLIEDFQKAIDEDQFHVYYQPKFDVRPEIPVLASAEALVRWRHPDLGMISPGVFIPLFEDNGLIQKLDHYVWRTTARQIRTWKDRLGFAVPVSVNVSRIDMYDPHLIDVLLGLIEEYGLKTSELLLEITESAYTQDSEQIIETVNKLRDLGFHIEMDDFGTAYSSLNMISTLPIDALKLDMQFIRNAFSQRKDTRMLEVIIDIADYLDVPVIAEGVETQEQLNALKAMGCDLVQGYYFSRPVPAGEYEQFVLERRDQDVTAPAAKADRKKEAKDLYDTGFGKIACALSSGFERVYYVDIENSHYVEFSSEGKYEDLQIERSGSDFFADIKDKIPGLVYRDDITRVSACMEKRALIAQLADGLSYSLTYRINKSGAPVYYNLKAVRANTHDDHHIVIGVSNVDLQIRQSGAVAAGDPSLLDFERMITQEQELEARQHNTATYSRIAAALAKDYFSIYYVDAATGHFIEYSSSEAFKELKIETSGSNFFAQSRENMKRVGCAEDLSSFLYAFTKENIMNALDRRGVFTLTYRLMFSGVPTYVHLKATRMGGKDDPHIVVGVSNIDAQIRREQEQAMALRTAREVVNRDPLTGVKSKHAFTEVSSIINESISGGNSAPFAVAVCDVNKLKLVNDTLGHTAGDELICSASRVICKVFAHSPVYRYGGDEFVAILRGDDYEKRAELIAKLGESNDLNSRGGGAVIACGMSEFDPEKDTSIDDAFKRADAKMYEDKKRLKEKDQQ